MAVPAFENVVPVPLDTFPYNDPACGLFQIGGPSIVGQTIFLLTVSFVAFNVK